MRAGFRLGFVLLIVAGCSSTPSPSPAGTPAAPGATTPPGSAAASSDHPDPTAPFAWNLPPGAQFGPAEELPKSAGWGWVYVANDGSTLFAPGRGSDGSFRLAVSTAEGAWEDRAFVDMSLTGPRGFEPDTLDNGWSRGFVADMASGPLGTVAVGTREYRSSSGSPTVRSAAWFSPDLVTWKRSAFADVLGGDVAVQVTGVAAEPNGFVAVATVSPIDLKGPSSIAVLRSANGVDWTRSATIESPFSLDAAIHAYCATSWLVACRTPLVAQDGRLLLAGTEFVCDTSAGGIFPTRRDGVRFAAQLRLWSSSDKGTTWAPVDLLASEVVSTAKPAPTTVAACPPYTTLEARQAFGADVGTRGSFAGAVAGSVVVVDGDRVAVTTDLRTWTSGGLAGAVPEGGYLVNLPAGPKMLVSDAQGLAIVSLEPQRKSERAIGPDYQAIVWRLDGSAWVRLDLLPKPIALKPTTDRLKLLGPDLAVLLGGGTIYRSHAGPLVPWGP